MFTTIWGFFKAFDLITKSDLKFNFDDGKRMDTEKIRDKKRQLAASRRVESLDEKEGGVTENIENWR